MVCAISSISGRVHIEFGPSTLETTDADAPDINCLTAQAQTDEQVDADNTNCGEREREREREREIWLEKYTTLIWLCPDFSPMMHYLTTGKLPTNDDEARKIVFSSPNYIILDGALYHFHTPRTKNVARANAVMKQLCVPTTLRPEVARQLHDRNCHAGADWAYALARTKFYWPGMYVFLRQHVLTCLRCQQSKRPIRSEKTPLTSLTVPPLLTRFHLDFHGPLPTSKGKRHILVLIDSTSMWVELIAVEDLTAETVVRALFDNVAARFGAPSALFILTDNGAAFIGQLTNLFCRSLDIRQYFTTPYHPQTNVRAEELADTIHNSLRTVCEEQSDWVDHLQAVAMAYRATTTTNTGLSPHEVVFGRPMKMNIDWLLPTSETPVTNAEQYAREIAPKLEILHKIAMENAAYSAGRHRIRHDEGATVPRYAVGDKVLLLDVTLKKGESIKLKRRYTGPFLIIECRPGYNYRFQHTVTGRDLKRAVHANRLRLLRELPNDYRNRQGENHATSVDWQRKTNRMANISR
jgi:transposase InsO family protein